MCQEPVGRPIAVFGSSPAVATLFSLRARRRAMPPRKRKQTARAEPHPWEVASSTGHPWETPATTCDDDVGWPKECSDDDFVEVDDSGSSFVSYMYDLLMTGTLSCNRFCIAMHFAHLAGIEAAGPYGFPPGRPSGHYARHLKFCMGSAEEWAKFYDLELPGYHKK